MPKLTIDAQIIDQLRSIQDLTPVTYNYYEDWNFRVFDRKDNACKNYLSPNRRNFFKILFINKGKGIFNLGINTFYIEQPTIIFIHPNEIISWKNLSSHSSGHYCLFKKQFIDQFQMLKKMINRFPFFSDSVKSVVPISESRISKINHLFYQMHEEVSSKSKFIEDALQAYTQLIMVESMKESNYMKPHSLINELRHIHSFFRLLEQEVSMINKNTQLKMKKAKEFAEILSLHPNYLNALLKTHTGQTVSAHIKNRILDECKTLLIQTNWSLQDIGYTVGFDDQPNFSHFFKKYTGITPNEFRKDHNK